MIVKWQIPTQWNNGTPLPAAAIRYYNVYYGPVEGQPSAFVSVDAPETQVELGSFSTPQWCTITAVAEAEDGTLRESSYGDYVSLDPDMAPAPPINAMLVLPTPPKCLAQDGCNLNA